jgi:hypothetical protein
MFNISDLNIYLYQYKHIQSSVLVAGYMHAFIMTLVMAVSSSQIESVGQV